MHALRIKYQKLEQESAEIDWQMIVLRLRKALGSVERIHRITGMDWQHLNRLARGEVKEPRFSSGMKLLNLHWVYCRESHRLENIVRE